MADFYLVTYILVILWIQKCVNGEDVISIWSNTTTVSPREPYTITCQTIYHKLLLIKNNDYIVNEECEVQVNRKEYRCSSSTYKNFGYIVKLTVPNGEENPTTVNWECRYVPTSGSRSVIRYENIRVRNPGERTTDSTEKRTTDSTEEGTADSTEESTTDSTGERTTDSTEERTTDSTEERITDSTEERTTDSTEERMGSTAVSTDSRMLIIFFGCQVTLMMAVIIAFGTLFYRKFMVLEKHFKRFAATPSGIPAIDVHNYESLQKTVYENMDSK